MSKSLMSIVVLAAMGWPAAAGADDQKRLDAIVKKTSGALVGIRFVVPGNKGPQTISGQGICVAADGVFMTTVVDPRQRASDAKDFKIIVPRETPETIDAKFMGMDRASGLSFVRATQKRDWPAITFAKSDLTIGQRVVSVGLLRTYGGHSPYLGVAWISAALRAPDRLFYVTGGKLTNRGSPVFMMDGRAVGIVGRQLVTNFQTPTKRGTVPLGLIGMQETSYFIGAVEFLHILAKPPTGGEILRRAWLGIGRLETPPKDPTAATPAAPGVMINQVIPGQPAHKAGLRDRDVIVALGGKPLAKLSSPDLTRRNLLLELSRLRPGQTVKLTVRRGSETKDYSVVLAPMPTQPFEAPRLSDNKLGFAIRERSQLEMHVATGAGKSVQGLIVFAVGRDSPAQDGGLRIGDMVTNVNDQPVRTVGTFAQIVKEALETGPGKAITLFVRRGEETVRVNIQP